MIANTPIVSIFHPSSKPKNNIQVQGWIRNKRNSKQISFITINDGSCLQSLQIVLDHSQFSESSSKDWHIGASVQIFGDLVASQGAKQTLEMQAKSIQLLGASNTTTYPLQPKKHSLDFLRENIHLRIRTNTFSAIFRIRHALSFAIHQYFHEKNFFCVHTPILTQNDTEGAGELFKVTTLPLNNVPKNEQQTVDFSKDFFSKKCHLTVSGQLHGEIAAMGLGKIYTFGPTFRAENSNTTRHLAEFWMVEPEMAFYDLHNNITLATDFLKYIIGYVWDTCKEDLCFLAQRKNSSPCKQSSTAFDNMPLMDKIQQILTKPCIIISYTEAIAILEKSQPYKKNKFQYPIKWGIDLQAEHEKYLVEKYFQQPVVITDYPQSIKAFYMRQNEDGKTVAAMDILFPGVGEVIGGSQREERIDYLSKAMQYWKVDQEKMSWYLDTRRFGTVPHSGFGMGLERLLLFLTGMENIRDVVPFPRTPGKIDC